MTEEEAEELNRYLDARLRELQEPDIARQDDLTYRDADGFVRRLSPRKRLALTIEALESQIALEDISTYREARRDIAAVVEGFDGVTVEVVPLQNELADVGAVEAPFAFEALPDLSDLRERLRVLSERIRYDPEPDGDYHA
jgi:hypothetical protein